MGAVLGLSLGVAVPRTQGAQQVRLVLLEGKGATAGVANAGVVNAGGGNSGGG